MRTSGRRGRVCVFVNSCVFMYTMTQTHSIPAKSLVYETPHTSPPSGPIQHGVQRAPRLATNGDPLPVLSPFNDWISSRLPSSRVIAWWSARCCARAGGSAWQSVWCWLGQGWAEIAAAEAFGVAVWTVTAQGFHTERDRNETAPCSQRKEGIMERLFLFAEPNKDCVTPKASLYTHTHTQISHCVPLAFFLSFTCCYRDPFFLQNHYYCSF